MPAGEFIEIKNLKKYYTEKHHLVKAVDDVSLSIKEGEILGLVGESGCGKSTLGKCLLRLVHPSNGEIQYQGESILKFNRKQLKNFRRETGFIFQDPYNSLNPRMTAFNIIAEPLEIHKLYRGSAKKKRVQELFDLVGLPQESINRFPHEFSGGQRQRIGIARALAVNPRFVICDEAISSLDVSVQAQIINLLKKLQKEMSLTYLFISHDLRVVKYLSTHVAVMYLGQILEIAPADQLYADPLHPYTKALLSSIPIPDPKIERNRTRMVLHGEAPSPINPPKGCPFVTRCPYATTTCHHARPNLREILPGHKAACHLLQTKIPYEEKSPHESEKLIQIKS